MSGQTVPRRMRVAGRSGTIWSFTMILVDVTIERARQDGDIGAIDSIDGRPIIRFVPPDRSGEWVGQCDRLDRSVASEVYHARIGETVEDKLNCERRQ